MCMLNDMINLGKDTTSRQQRHYVCKALFTWWSRRCEDGGQNVRLTLYTLYTSLCFHRGMKEHTFANESSTNWWECRLDTVPFRSFRWCGAFVHQQSLKKCIKCIFHVPGNGISVAQLWVMFQSGKILNYK